MMRATYFLMAAITSLLCAGNALAQSSDDENSAKLLFGEPRPKFTSTMEAIEYFRHKDGLTQEEQLSPVFQNGVAIVDGKDVVTPHILDHLSKDVPAGSLQDRLILMAYLKDKSLRVRCLAAFALNRTLQAYPDGMSMSDVSDVDSVDHKKMIEVFAEKIAEQAAASDG